jgi:hypothetical protein
MTGTHVQPHRNRVTEDLADNTILKMPHILYFNITTPKTIDKLSNCRLDPPPQAQQPRRPLRVWVPTGVLVRGQQLAAGRPELGRDEQPGRAGGPPGGDCAEALGGEPDRGRGGDARGAGQPYFGRTAAREGRSWRRWWSCSATVRVTSWSSTTPHCQSRPSERPDTAFQSCTPSYLHRPGKPVPQNRLEEPRSSCKTYPCASPHVKNGGATVENQLDLSPLAIADDANRGPWFWSWL